MDTYTWTKEYESIASLIHGKIETLKQAERKVDTSKPESYNMAILKRIEAEKKFIDSLLAFMLHTENLIKDMEASNKHLTFQNTINFVRARIYEAEIENGFEKKIRDEFGIGLKN